MIMKHINTIMRKAVSAVAFMAIAVTADAAEAVFRIVEFNKTTGEFALAASGTVPQDSWAYFQNDYGATTGNRYNQIPRNRKAVLWLEGWQGCTIKGITLNMCSNNKAGQVGLSVSDGETEIFKFSPVDFADADWFGQWVSKDLGVYVDVTKQIDAPALTADVAGITVKGGTKEGSVYLNSITIDYEEAPGMALESPLGWIYEKMDKKSKLNEGDELMIFRNGCAAADIDGMEKSQYLDAITIASTTDVTDPEVLRFTANKAETEGFWTLTDQYGRKLGAKGKQALAWNEGATNWTIETGYDGATIASENTSYGTLRYNEPVGSYARFNIYTSKTLPLPFLYRKSKQHEAVTATELTLGETEITASVADGNIALKPTLKPATTTDRRIVWTSSNESVATVNGGFVTLLGEGETTIHARTADGGAQTNVRLIVSAASGISNAATAKGASGTYKMLDGKSVIIVKGSKSYTTDGTRR